MSGKATGTFLLDTAFRSSMNPSVDRGSETQHPKPCWYPNMLGFSRFLVISGFSVPLKTLCCAIFSRSPFNPTYKTNPRHLRKYAIQTINMLGFTCALPNLRLHDVVLIFHDAPLAVTLAVLKMLDYKYRIEIYYNLAIKTGMFLMCVDVFKGNTMPEFRIEF